MTGLLDLGAAAETGPAIEMRLKIPVAMSNSAPNFMRIPPYQRTISQIGFCRIEQSVTIV
jgi:hypothetical protein